MRLREPEIATHFVLTLSSYGMVVSPCILLETDRGSYQNAAQSVSSPLFDGTGLRKYLAIEIPMKHMFS